jgi:small subunit ribosomal protein S2
LNGDAKSLVKRESDIVPTLEGLMHAGVHLGHHSSQLDQRATPFIFGKRFDSHIIDLEKTLVCLKRAMNVAQEISRMGGTILFVGTRDFLARPVYEAAKSTKQFFIQRDQPWKQGILTNRDEVLRNSIATDGSVYHYPANSTWGNGFQPPIGVLELHRRENECRQSQTNSDSFATNTLFGGSQPQTTGHSQVLLPDLVIILDGPFGEVAMKEAISMQVPTIGIVDTNMDPNLMTYPIPGNDDALSSVQYILNCLVASILNGQTNRGNHTMSSAESSVPSKYRYDTLLDAPFPSSSSTSKYAKAHLFSSNPALERKKNTDKQSN